MKGIIPTGGRGTRMRPITFSANKHFVPIANKPLIHYPIESVISAGIKDIGITYNPGYLELVKQYLGDGSKWSANFTYILQPEPIGLANIVQVCEDYLQGDSFVFHLGDNIFTEGIKPLVDHFRKHKLDGALSVIHHQENFRMGVPYFDKKGKLVKLVEKPKSPPNDLALPGAYVANSNFFKMFHSRDRLKPSARGEYEIPDAFQWLIDHSYRVETVELPGKWLDPGKLDDWLVANQFILDTTVVHSPANFPGEDSVKIEGRVHIGSNCRLSNSTIRGPVIIGDNVTIEGSFIGPYTSISDNCRVINGAIQNSVVMDKTHVINVSKMIEGSVIGPNSEIVSDSNRYLQLFIGEMSHIQL